MLLEMPLPGKWPKWTTLLQGCDMHDTPGMTFDLGIGLVFNSSSHRLVNPDVVEPVYYTSSSSHMLSAMHTCDARDVVPMANNKSQFLTSVSSAHAVVDHRAILFMPPTLDAHIPYNCAPIALYLQDLVTLPPRSILEVKHLRDAAPMPARIPTATSAVDRRTHFWMCRLHTIVPSSVGSSDFCVCLIEACVRCVRIVVAQGSPHLQED